MGIATQVESAIDGLLTNFVVSTSTAFTTMLMPLALTAITIYVISMGWAITRGETNDSLSTFTWKSFRIALITGIALSAGEYQATVVEGVEGIQIAFISAFTPTGTIGGLVDNMAAPFDALGQQLWSEAVTGFWPNWSLIFAAALVAIAQAFLFVVGLGLFLLAKVSLALVLAIGPVFILLAIFPATQRYTESWLAQALTFVMLNVLVGASIAMLTDFASQFAQHIANNQTTINVLRACMSLLLCSGALGIVMLNHSSLAAALTGGMTLSGIGRELGRAIMRGSGRRKAGPDAGGGDEGGSMSRSGPRPPSRVTSAPASSGARPLYQRNVLENIRRAST